MPVDIQTSAQGTGVADDDRGQARVAQDKADAPTGTAASPKPPKKSSKSKAMLAREAGAIAAEGSADRASPPGDGAGPLDTILNATDPRQVADFLFGGRGDGTED
jgi:hypothetical protein